MNRKQLGWVKIALHLLALLPLVNLTLQVLTDNAGGDPVQYIIHFLGKGALNLLLLTLTISPLARWSGQGMLMQLRRPLGLWAFAYGLCHLTAYASLDLLFDWPQLVNALTERPYIIVGATALLILTALALTSLKSAQRRMGRHWQTLHKGVYLAAVLIVVHYYWSVKSAIIEPLLYAAILAVLLAWRLRRLQQRMRTQSTLR